MPKKERKLTPLELKRKAYFETKSQELAQEGYIKRDLTITPLAANILGVAIMLPILVIFEGLFLFFNQSLRLRAPLSIYLLFIGSFLILIVAHEAIHGLTWSIFTKDHWKSIEFGFIPTMLMPYCTCNAPLNKAQYIAGALMPTIVFGIIPSAIGIISGNSFFFYLGLIMTLCGGGDILITFKLLFLKGAKKSSIYMDHPYECGMVAFERS